MRLCQRLTEGDTEAYLSFVGRYEGSDHETADDFELGPHFRVRLDRNPATAMGDEWPALTEYALYSPSGRWGILTSLEWCGIAVGSFGFRSHLSSAPEFADSSGKFLEYWRDSRDRLKGRTSWVPALIENVYGATQAAKILSDFGDATAWLRNG